MQLTYKEAVLLTAIAPCCVEVLIVAVLIVIAIFTVPSVDAPYTIDSFRNEMLVCCIKHSCP